MDGREEYEATRAALAAKAKAILTAHIAKVFVELPEIAGMRWSQYTPYFNDGDQCVFRLHYDLELLVDGAWVTEYTCGGRYKRFFVSPLLAPWKGSNEVLLEMFLASFGDHARVDCLRQPNGSVAIHVEAYEHE